jgi:hypothetical protein
MNQTRIYVPLGTAAVRRLAAERRLGAPVHAHAVTDRVERSYPGADEEEWEYAALCDAAEAAALLRANPMDRRVVVAADVDPSWVSPGEGPESAVEVAEDVPLQRVVSFHVDEDGGADDEELLWYDATELDELLRLL